MGDVDGRALPREDNYNSRSVDEMLCGPKQTGNEPERPKRVEMAADDFRSFEPLPVWIVRSIEYSTSAFQPHMKWNGTFTDSKCEE